MGGIKRKVDERVRSIKELNEFTRDRELMITQPRTMLILHIEDLQDELLRCSKLLEHCLWHADTLARIAGVEIIARHKEEEEIS